jgi:hypothetical protein
LILTLDSAKRKFFEESPSSEDDQAKGDLRSTEDSDGYEREVEGVQGGTGSAERERESVSETVRTEVVEATHPIPVTVEVEETAVDVEETSRSDPAPVEVQEATHAVSVEVEETPVEATQATPVEVLLVTGPTQIEPTDTTQPTPTPTPQQLSTDVSHLLSYRDSPYTLIIGCADYFTRLTRIDIEEYLRRSLDKAAVIGVCALLCLPICRTITKRDASQLIINYFIRLKAEYNVTEFNALIDTINLAKPDFFRLPYLPPVVSAIPILNRSLQLSSQFTRPAMPFGYDSQAGIKPITGSVFLDAADLEFFGTDFYFEIPRSFEGERKILLCLYRCGDAANGYRSNREAIRQRQVAPARTFPLAQVCTASPMILPPSVLDLTLNGTELDGFFRFNRSHVFDITSVCVRNRSNRLRSNKLPASVREVDHLVLEIIGLVPRAPLSDHFEIRNNNSVNMLQAPRAQNSLGYACLQGEPLLKDKDFVLNMLKPSHSDDIVFADDSITVDLRCPISLGKIRRPVRFKHCKHPQCFDYEVFKQFASAGLTKSKDVKCPVCFTAVPRTAHLIECGLMRGILNEIGSRAVDKVKIDLTTGNLIKNDTATSASASADGDGIDLIDSEDEGSDGENGLRLAMQQATPPIVLPEEFKASKKSFTFIDLCDSDEDEENRRPAVINIY